jgi:hypothetical protein
VTVDTEKLRALATAATAGPWFGPRITDAWPPGEYGVYAADEEGQPIPGAIIARMDRPIDEEDDQDEPRRNAAFIAAAHPLVVIELLDEIDQLRRKVNA